MFFVWANAPMTLASQRRLAVTPPTSCWLKYELIDPDSYYSLPIFLKMGQAQRYDSVLGIATLHEARRLYQDYTFVEFSADRTKLWKKRYAIHSASEPDPLRGCPDKRKKIDYGLERAKVRSNRQWFTRCALAAMCQHLDAWFMEARVDPSLLIACLIQEPEAA